MKTRIGLKLILAVVLIAALNSCEKDKDPVTSGSITDIDGNTYITEKIGDQWWMAQNLKVTHYNDGTEIPNITDDEEWGNLTTGAYCWFDNDESAYKNKYGAMYNWYTVETGKLCPTGWHVSTDAEWTELTDYLEDNGYGYEGSGNDIGMAMASSSYWNESSVEGTVGYELSSNNTSGFNALPGGIRFNNGTFGYLGYYGYWWTATESSAEAAWYWYMFCYDSQVLNYNYDKEQGYSVRCVMD